MSWFAHLVPTCQEMARLLFDAMDYRLPWHVRIWMHAHLRICQVCSSYQRQLQFLRNLLRRTPHSEAELIEPPGLSACIEVHTDAARKAGASEEELVEAGFVAAALRAGAAVTHATHLIKD